jgi:hypothetical protein
MIKITYISGTTTYVARPTTQADVSASDSCIIGQIAFFIDTPTTIGDTLTVNRTGDVFTFVNMMMIASAGEPNGPYFKLQRVNTGYTMYESRTIDGTYYLVSGIVLINQGRVYPVTSNSMVFQVDDRSLGASPNPNSPIDSIGSPLPPATSPVKTEKGVVKDTPTKGSVGIGGTILLFVLLFILGIVLLYLLLRGSGEEE